MGRRVATLSVVVCGLSAVAVLAVSTAQFGWETVWGLYPGLKVHLPPFIDVRQPVSAVECTRAGVDVYVANPCDPSGRPYNYTPVLLVPPLSYLAAVPAVVLGWTLAVVSVLTLGLVATTRQTRSVAVALLAVFLSPPVAMLVEVGNIDSVVFALTATGAVLLGRGSLDDRPGYALLVAACVLKVYPIPAVFATAVLRRTRAAAVAAATSLAVVVFYLVQYPRMYSNTTFVTTTSYGSAVGFEHLAVQLGQLGVGLSAIDVRLLGLAAVLPVVLGATAAAYNGANDDDATPFDPTRPADTLFVAGAAVYVGTFVLGYNFDYRLVFLATLIPYLDWLRDRTGAARFGQVGLAAVFGLLFTPTLYHVSWWLEAVNEAFGWLLFAFLCFVLGRMLFSQRPVAELFERVPTTAGR